MNYKEYIENGKAVLGVEFGSTRIKAVLIGKNHEPIAQGSFSWENRLENDIWTYHIEEIEKGLQGAYANLCEDVKDKYDAKICSLRAMGVSAMMHGYLAFDTEDQLLVPFRTWRNTMTQQAADDLTEAFSFNIPQRWSIAHLYQAILNQEEHVARIHYMTTLAGYIHWKMTSEKVLGIGDAAGMFPIDSTTNQYDTTMLNTFDELVRSHNVSWRINEILPTVKSAGEVAGILTKEGARLIDPTGALQAGIPLCPPEGDAGTGMVATNSIASYTGNVSAGTSIFAMIVLDKGLDEVHTEIDMVTTPDGKPVAMVHCNNCTSDLNAWVNLLKEAHEALGGKTDMDTIYETLYHKALEGDVNCGGLMSYNYYSGEPITHVEEGRPLFIRTPDANFSLANFMRTHLYSAMATLKLGMDILEQEGVVVNKLMAHGGLFKTKIVAQKLMAGALKTPVSVMETAGEGGAWGMALLADYCVSKKEKEELASYLENQIFKEVQSETIEPDFEDSLRFHSFMQSYKEAIQLERLAQYYF